MGLKFALIFLISLLSACMPIQFDGDGSPISPVVIPPSPVGIPIVKHLLRCSDPHATNIGAESACSCPSGYSIDDTGLHCVLITAPICQTYTKQLTTDLILNPGDTFGDPTKLALYMQTDGNLVLYNGLPNSTNTLWNSQTSGCGVNCSAHLQGDGNFVVYDGSNAVKFNAATVGCNLLTITNCSLPALKISGCSNSYSSAPLDSTQNWVNCSNNGGQCLFSGLKTVRYGTPGNYIFKNLVGPISCSTLSFEGDPAPGNNSKVCDFNSNTVSITQISEPTVSLQNVSMTDQTNLNVQAVTDMYGFLNDNNGMPFNWGYMNPTARSFVEVGITIPQKGDFNIGVFVANPGSNSVTITLNGNSFGTMMLPNTGNYYTYQETWIPLPVTIPAGTYRLKATFDAGTSINLGGIYLKPML